MQTPEQIAEGLSERQAWAVYLGGAFGRSPISAKIMRPLERRGLASRIEQKGFQVRWQLTPLGHSVREILITKEARRG